MLINCLRLKGLNFARFINWFEPLLEAFFSTCDGFNLRPGQGCSKVV